jgi:hypothetical protein
MVNLATEPTIDVGKVDQGTGGSSAWKVDGSAVTQPVSIAAPVAVTGTFYQATQPVSGTVSISGTPTVSGTVSVSNFPATQPISGTVAVSSLPSIPAGTNVIGHVIADSGSTTAVTGNVTAVQPTGTNLHVVVDSAPSTAVTGTFFQTTQPVSGTVTANAGTGSFTVAQATAANLNATVTGTVTTTPPSNASTNITQIGGSSLAFGSALSASSIPVVIASDNAAVATTTPDSYVIGQSAQTALVNNILTTSAGTAATDLSGYHSASVQVVSTGTGGAYTFEGSNDNVNFQAAPVFNQAVANGAVGYSPITASAASLIYTLPVTFRYLRLRISTAITGGSIQAFSRFGQEAWAPAVFTVAQNTAANLLTTATIGTPGPTTDVASAVLNATTTTGAFTPSFGSSYQVTIPVTAISGTPTLDVEIQESRDATNWVAVYDFPRISATGVYYSPVLPLTGPHLRYVQTLGGTTSFTRSIVRTQDSTSPKFLRQIIDRTVTLTSLNSTTATLQAEQQCTNVQMVINIGAATTGPTLQIQGSDDGGASWYSVGLALLGVANSSVQVTVNNVTSQQYRAIVTIVGNTVTAGYVLLRAF